MQALLCDGLYASGEPAAAVLGAPLVAGIRTRPPFKRPDREEPLFLQRETRLPPLNRKPGLYSEAWRRLEALPGVSHDCPMSLPCVSLVNFIGFAYVTEVPAVCLNSGHFAPTPPEMPSSSPPSSLPAADSPGLTACRGLPVVAEGALQFHPFKISASSEDACPTEVRAAVADTPREWIPDISFHSPCPAPGSCLRSTRSTR